MDNWVPAFAGNEIGGVAGPLYIAANELYILLAFLEPE
jgi:hypothetical protein